jgi:RimJ/RimL family protein N-acetyltransferase
MDLPTIETPRLLLRPWRDEDLEPFAALCADPRVMEFFPAPLSRVESEAFAARIRAHFAERGYGLWAVEVAGGASFIGFVGLQWATFAAAFTPALEVGFRLAAEHWGRGYATEGGRAAVRFAFEEVGVDEVVSFTAAVNVRAQRVIKRVGLVRDPGGDFEHARVAEGHRLRTHRLFRVSREDG